eukprot:NODE_240_length_11935_cov_0.818773.p8 type:complete len:203 gc:universal NODE_240_length_11935_cov_0.818773:7795-8403(+)
MHHNLENNQFTFKINKKFKPHSKMSDVTTSKKLDIESPKQTRPFLMESETIICMSYCMEQVRVNVTTGDKIITPNTSQIRSINKSASGHTIQTELKEVDRWIALTDKGRFLVFGRKTGSMSEAEKIQLQKERDEAANKKKNRFKSAMDELRNKQVDVAPVVHAKNETVKTIDQHVNLFHVENGFTRIRNDYRYYGRSTHRNI